MVGLSVKENLIYYCSTMNRTLLLTSSEETSNMYRPFANSFATYLSRNGFHPGQFNAFKRF
jgi:hypothetical protein